MPRAVATRWVVATRAAPLATMDRHRLGRSGRRPDLGVAGLLADHKDPRTDERSYKLVNIVRGEPDLSELCAGTSLHWAPRLAAVATMCTGCVLAHTRRPPAAASCPGGHARTRARSAAAVGRAPAAGDGGAPTHPLAGPHAAALGSCAARSRADYRERPLRSAGALVRGGRLGARLRRRHRPLTAAQRPHAARPPPPRRRRCAPSQSHDEVADYTIKETGIRRPEAKQD